MARPRVYTDKQMLDRLRDHTIERLGSIYTVHKPTWNAYLKRMASDPDFGVLVRDVVAESLNKWEQIGIDAIRSDNPNFNANLYRYLTQNKKPFLTHEVLELEARIEALEKHE